MPRLPLTRRRLLGLLGLAGVGGAATACVGSGGSTASGTNKPGQKIADASALPVGSARSFTEPDTGKPAVLYHPDAATFVALRAVCTHAGCTVAFDPAAKLLLCPCHGSEFDPATGTVVRGPAGSPLTKVAVAVKSGVVETA
jgi:Rieske Fe-S protein